MIWTDNRNQVFKDKYVRSKSKIGNKIKGKVIMVDNRQLIKNRMTTNK